VLLQNMSDSDSEIDLKIGQYLMKLRRTKNVPFLESPCNCFLLFCNYSVAQ